LKIAFFNGSLLKKTEKTNKHKKTTNKQKQLYKQNTVDNEMHIVVVKIILQKKYIYIRFLECSIQFGYWFLRISFPAVVK